MYNVAKTDIILFGGDFPVKTARIDQRLAIFSPYYIGWFYCFASLVWHWFYLILKTYVINAYLSNDLKHLHATLSKYSKNSQFFFKQASLKCISLPVSIF